MNNQAKLIDAEKLKMWILENDDAEPFMESEYSGDAFTSLCSAIFSGELDPDTPPVPTIKPGDKARHPDLGEVVVVWVGDNIAEVAVGMAHYDVSLKDLEVVE